MDILDLDAVDVVALIRQGKVSAVEVMQQTLARVAQVNAAHTAIVSMADPDTILRAARAQDAQADKSGALFGLPLAVKDLSNAQGFPTSMGSPAFPMKPADHDDLFVARMRAAGANVFGKTNTPEFGLGSHTFNPVHGTTANAYDSTRSAGGSSGGAAVALATRMVAIADGSDMMGSLRNPAGWNNVYGMRPTWGLVPSEPLGDTFGQQLSTNGPMARSPRDLALLLGVQSGPDPRQPHGRPAQNFLTDMQGHSLSGARIGYLGAWGLPTDPGIMDITQNAVQNLEHLGASIDIVKPPFDMDALWHAWTTLRHWAVCTGLFALYDNPKTRNLLKPAAVWEIENGLKLSIMDIHRASVIRSQWYTRAAALFDTYDAVILPSAQVWPFDKTMIHPTDINGVAMDTYHRWMQVVIPAGLIGLPVVNLPIGFGDTGGFDTGLPAGMQMIGAKGSDARLLGYAHDWHVAHPYTQIAPAI